MQCWKVLDSRFSLDSGSKMGIPYHGWNMSGNFGVMLSFSIIKFFHLQSCVAIKVQVSKLDFPIAESKT